MEYRRLGRSDISVSAIGLGTMTFGRQNDEKEAFELMDAAVDAGVNFFDAAESYPAPVAQDPQGATEEYIGAWLKARGVRDKIVLATKACGPCPGLPNLRQGPYRLDRGNIEAALDGSLKRLGTDHVDLYQLHWPDRKIGLFGSRDGAPGKDDGSVPPEETLAVLDDMIKAGKVRHVGISNETAWGAMTFVHKAETSALPRLVSIQNAYNLLNRTFEEGLHEIAMREDLGLIAYAPMAAGTLSGKYLNGALPKGSRIQVFGGLSRYQRPRAEPAVAAYVALARAHGLDPAQMALAFVRTRPFVTSALAGATTRAQLTVDLASRDLVLPDEVSEGIDAIHEHNPNPCP